MSSIKNVLSAKAEAILMGLMQPVEDNAEAEFICDYICTVLRELDTTGEEILKLATQYAKGATVKYIHIGRIQGFKMLTLVLKPKTSKAKEIKLESRNGVFSYVYNFDAPDLSELGYTFFRKTPKGFSRIG